MYKINFICITGETKVCQELDSMIFYMYDHINDIIALELTKDDHEITWSDCSDSEDPYPIWVKFIDGECHGVMTVFDAFEQAITLVRADAWQKR